MRSGALCSRERLRSRRGGRYRRGRCRSRAAGLILAGEQASPAECLAEVVVGRFGSGWIEGHPCAVWETGAGVKLGLAGLRY